MCRSNRPGSRLLHRHSRRSRSPKLPPPTKDLCGSRSNPNFRRGVGIIWVDCGINSEHTSRPSTMLKLHTSLNHNMICIDYRLLGFKAILRTLGNSGGHFSRAVLISFASLFVIPRLSRSGSVSATILHPTVLNNCVALPLASSSEIYLFGLICKS
jgi:hypothetical protein